MSWVNVLRSRLLVAAATDVSQGGRLIPLVEVSRTLLRASIFFVELYTDVLIFHLTVKHVLNILTSVVRVLGRLAVATAAVRRFRIPRLSVYRVRLGSLLEPR